MKNLLCKLGIHLWVETSLTPLERSMLDESQPGFVFVKECEICHKREMYCEYKNGTCLKIITEI